VTFGHGRWRRRVALLAMDALPAAERAATAAHVAGCARCAEALGQMAQVRDLLAVDPAVSSPPPVPFETLEARVRARLREPEPPPRRAVSWTLAPAAAAAAVVAIAGAWMAGGLPPPPPSPTEPPRTVAQEAASEEMLRRMERSLAREQAARYLAEAQDVLVTVAAGPPPCPKRRETVEIEDEIQKSRDLLDRRALVVDPGREEVASAQPVLAEVEEMLSQVAALPSCVRRGQLEALEKEMERRRLLMKIDLMTRELQG
jgi:hypothetical protein